MTPLDVARVEGLVVGLALAGLLMPGLYDWYYQRWERRARRRRPRPYDWARDGEAA